MWLILKLFFFSSIIEFSKQQFSLISFNTTDTNCASNEFFDITKLKCSRCPNNSRPIDNFNCKCIETYYFTMNNGGDSIKCSRCSQGLVQTLDGFNCIEPPNTSCNPNEIQTDTELNGTSLISRQCITCDSTNSKPQENNCKSCKPLIFAENDNQIISNATCSLNSLGGVLFFDNSITIPLNNIDSYFDNAGESWLFKEYSVSNFRTCRLPTRRNMTSCQFLANMCVLKLYTEQPLMIEYDKLFNRNETNSIPWIKYNQNLQSYKSEYATNGVNSEFFRINLKKKCENKELEIVSAEYDLWGSFKGLKTFDVSNLQLCNSGLTTKVSPFTTTNVITKCTVDIQSLFELSDSKATLFYDLFLKFDNGTKMLPIPVLIRETNKPGNFEIYRRFFLYETTSSKKSPNTQSTHIRFAKSIKIKIEMVPSKSNGEIYPPVIEIEYDTARRDEEKNVDLSFEIEYIMDTNSFKKTFFIFFGVLAGLALLWSFIGICNWNRRSGRFLIDIIVLFKLLMFLIGSVANAMIIVLALISMYWFIVYRSQTSVALFLPNLAQEKIYGTFLIVAFVLKLLDVLYMILVQTSYDIFFIDWERPKSDEKIIELKNKLPPIQSKNSTPDDSVYIKEIIREQNKISCWRTLFVANEWNELQTYRKINSTLQLILVLFLLKVINLEYFARQACEAQINRSDNDYEAPYSRILRLGLGSLVFVGVEFFQLIFFTLIYSRCVEDKIGQFVDFCSVSNISVFIMTHTQFGYYIHGRSPHGYSDTSMYKMTQALIRENTDLSAKRGLEANSDHQTFSVKIPAKFSKEYSKVMSPLYMQRSVNRAIRRDSITSSNEFEKRMVAYTQLNNFLITYLNNSVRNMSYTVVKRTLLENIFNYEFRQSNKNGFFYKDDLDCFTDTIYFGNEKKLFIFDLLIFLFIDYFSKNFVLAAFVVYFLTTFLKIIRSDLGKRNLSKKTLVDKRFLI